MPVDYSKWDKVTAEADADERKDPNATYAQRCDNHTASLTLIAQWLHEATPALKEKPAELRHLLQFIAMQHRGTRENNKARAAEVVALLSSRGAPPSEPLMALAKLADTKSKAAHGDAQEELKAAKVRSLALDALNTLHACATEGGARKVFDALHAEPDSELATKYRKGEFAGEALRAPPPEPAPEPFTWAEFRSKLGKALLKQLLMLPFAILLWYSMTSMLGQVPLHADDLPAERAPEPAPQPAAGDGFDF